MRSKCSISLDFPFLVFATSTGPGVQVKFDRRDYAPEKPIRDTLFFDVPL